MQLNSIVTGTNSYQKDFSFYFHDYQKDATNGDEIVCYLFQRFNTIHTEFVSKQNMKLYHNINQGQYRQHCNAMCYLTTHHLYDCAYPLPSSVVLF